MSKKESTKQQAATPKSASEHHLVLAKLERVSDPSVKTLWIDYMEITQRSDIDVATLRFYTVIPHPGAALQESSRLTTSMGHLKAIAELICRNIDYYPTKPKSGKTKE